MGDLITNDFSVNIEEGRYNFEYMSKAYYLIL